MIKKEIIIKKSKIPADVKFEQVADLGDDLCRLYNTVRQHPDAEIDAREVLINEKRWLEFLEGLMKDARNIDRQTAVAVGMTWVNKGPSCRPDVPYDEIWVRGVGSMLNDMLGFDGSLALDIEPENDTEIVQETEQEKEQGWQIQDDLQADWAIEKIKAYRAELERKKRLAEEKIRQVQEWYQKEEEKVQKHIDFFQHKLYEYFTSLDPALLKKTKTQTKYELISGVLKIKRRTPEIKRDNQELVNWLEENGLKEYIKTEKLPIWGELRKNIKIVGNQAVYQETGEIVPGIAVEPRPDEFIIE